MKPAPFSYHRPASVEALLDLLAEYGDDGKILAGGQSLVAAMNFRLARPAVLLDINALAAIDYLRVEGDMLHIGALTRHAAFHKPVVDGPLGHLLAEVVRHIAHYPIRQRGTFAGSLAHADPASEWCLLVTTLGGEMQLASSETSRSVEASSFFRGTFTTALRADELLSEIRLPLLGPQWRGGFHEFSRRAGDFALAMGLAALRLEGEVIAAARLGVGGVADRAIRLGALEQRLVGQKPTPALFDEVAHEASASIAPIADIHASAEYRRDLIGTVIRRALAQAAA